MASRAHAQSEPAAPATAPTPSRHREAKQVRTALKVSSPSDPAEREAVTTARRVVGMPAPRPIGPLKLRVEPQAALAPAIPVPRPQAPPGAAAPPPTTGGRPDAPPDVEAEVKGERGGGRALPRDVQSFMAPRFKADFSGVRIHTGPKAAKLATRLGARAFTFGRDVFFNSGEFRPETPGGMELIAHELTHTIQQKEVVQRDAAEAAAEPVTVRETSQPQAQRGMVSEALDWFADKANYIPGFRLFTIVIGMNPINQARVAPSGANILRALVEFLPGGGLIVEALDRYGIFERAGSFIEEQFRTLGMVGSMFRTALMQFLDSLGISDLFSPGSVWERAKRIFTEPVDRLISFGRTLVTGVLRFIREAILKPLAALAQNTRGYDLLKAVLGEDPVTGEAVPRNADTLIGGFMKLIGQEEIWQNIKKANAIPRAWAWFQTALSGLIGLVRSIPSRFMTTLRSLEIMDLVLPPRAFLKVGAAFASFVGDFLSWGLGTVMSLLEILFEVVAPRAVPYVKKAAGAFRTIVRNPIGFVRTLVAAGKLGFQQFGRNFLTHLQASLIGWLTGAMAGAGVYIPTGFSLGELIKFVLSVLGLTWTNIRTKLVAATNETVVRGLEAGFEIVRTLVTQGPAAAWQQIVEGITNLRDMVIEQIKEYVKSKVVEAAVTKLLSMLSPAGAFIQAIIATYNTIMFFVERLNQIAQVAASFIDSISAIASGTIAPAAARVERTMAGLLTLVISFLARIAGLGKVSDAVKRLIDRVRAPIDRALDRVVAWIVAQARRLGRFVAQAGVPHDPNERLRLAARAAIPAARVLRGRATKPALEAALSAVKLRYGLTTLEVFQARGMWRARAGINPQLTFDILNSDDDLLPRLLAAFRPAVAQLAPLPAPDRRARMRDVFERAFRQEHTGLAVLLPETRGRVTVKARAAGAPRELVVGAFDVGTGTGAGDQSAEIAAALVRGRAALVRLGPSTTWPAAEQAMRAALVSTGTIRESMISFVHTDAPRGRELFLTLDQRRQSLGVMRKTSESLHEEAGTEGLHTLYRNKLDGQIGVKGLGGIFVQQFIWRAITAEERARLDARHQPEAEVPWPSLPSRPGDGVSPRATDPVTHIVNAGVPSDFLSGTTVPNAQITNRRSPAGTPPQNFRKATGGRVKINLAWVPARDIYVVGTTTAVDQWKFGPGDEVGRRDAIATREVLIRGGLPARAIVEVHFGLG
jgi:hypothetical protein